MDLTKSHWPWAKRDLKKAEGARIFESAARVGANKAQDDEILAPAGQQGPESEQQASGTRQQLYAPLDANDQAVSDSWPVEGVEERNWAC